MIVFRI